METKTRHEVTTVIRFRDPGRGLRAFPAWWALAAAFAFAALCFFQVYRAKLDAIAGAVQAAEPAALVDLNRLESPADLQGVLASAGVDDPGASAGAIFEFAGRGPLTHVGDLHRLRDDAGEPVLSQRQIAEVKKRTVVRTPREWSAAFGASLLRYFASIGLLFLFLAWRNRGGDRALAAIAAALLGLGLALQFGLPDPLRDTLRGVEFSWGIVWGSLAFAVCSALHYQRMAARLTWLPLLAAGVLAAALSAFGTGPTGSDARVNLFGAQPAEWIKLLVVASVASFLAERWVMVRNVPLGRRKWMGMELPRLQDLFPLAAAAIGLAFFARIHDNGPALVLGGAVMLMWAVARKRWIGAAVAFFLLAGGLYAAVSLRPESFRTVATRIALWRSPFDNLAAGGDQIAQAIWAFASGGLFGQGLGRGFAWLISNVHNDLILAAVAEDLGFAGFALVTLLFGVLFHRGFRIALRSDSAYLCFLGIGLTGLLAVQTLIVAAGILGLMPLSGVVTPLLSFGKTGMIAAMASLGVLTAISTRNPEPEETAPFRAPARIALWAACVFGGAIVLTAAWYQVAKADATSLRQCRTRSSTNPKGDALSVVNPRFRILSRMLPAGAILSADGVPLATSSKSEYEAACALYLSLGADRANLDQAGPRYYAPFPSLVHLLGNLNNAMLAQSGSQVERAMSDTLREEDPVRLLPLLRHRNNPKHPAVKALLEKDRSVKLTINLRLQAAIERDFGREMERRKGKAGSVAIDDPETGRLLASVSYPWPKSLPTLNRRRQQPTDDELLDRVSKGMYPPGSTFKVAVAIAAMMKDAALASRLWTCSRLPGGRNGAHLDEWRVTVRDDKHDRRPHGRISLEECLAHSCNACFAQLGAYGVGAQQMKAMADLFSLRLTRKQDEGRLHRLLPFTSFGQGQVTMSPLQVLQLPATVAAHGVLHRPYLIEGEGSDPVLVVGPAEAALVRDGLRAAVLRGTAADLRRAGFFVAAKTGTAQVAAREQIPPHAWMTGFAGPARKGSRKIAFVVMVENGGYGRSLSKVTLSILESAGALGLIDRGE